MREAPPVTMLGESWLAVLGRALDRTHAVAGVLVELGCRYGGTARWLAERDPCQRELHVFDTFTGIPRVDPRYDGDLMVGQFRADEAVCRTVLAGLPSVVIHAGEFPDGSERGLRVAFCHVDMDTYAATRAAIEWLRGALVPGGVVVFDDLTNPDTPGVPRAMDELTVPYRAEGGQAIWYG